MAAHRRHTRPTGLQAARDLYRRIGLAAIAAAVGCVAALHVLRPDLAPVSRRLSEYAHGPFGWLMLVAFAATGAGLLAIALGEWHRREPAPRSRSVSLLLAVAGLGMLAAGVFTTDPAGEATRNELIHSATSGFATVALITAAALRVLDPLRAAGHGRGDVPGGVLAAAAIVLGVLSRVLHETPWTGLSQRVLWLTLTAWLLRVAWVSDPAGAHDGP